MVAVQSTVSILSNSSGGGGRSVGGGGNSKSARVGGGTDLDGLPPTNELCGALNVRKLDRRLSVLFLMDSIAKSIILNTKKKQDLPC